MQDHYRQPPPPPQPQPPQHHHQHQHLPPHHQHSPPQPQPYQSYPPRDTTVKREPADDLRRPNSTGHAPDNIPLPPPSAPPPIQTSHQPLPPHAPPPSYPDNQPRHMGYEPTHQAPPTPGGFRAPSYPPTPISHQPQFEHGGYSQPEFYPSVYSSAANKKKNTRASQACDQCRQLKAKCDETKPCKTCRDKGTECKYRDPVPKATDKAQADILEGISNMHNEMTRILGEFNHRLSKIESSLPRDGRGPLMKPEPAAEELKSVRSTSYLANNVPRNDSFYHDEVNGTGTLPIEPVAIHEDETETNPGPVVLPGVPAIPINHTTVAGLLLEWPSIRDLTRHHLEKERVSYISEYPIADEQKRGLLLVYGRGEDSSQFRKATATLDPGMLEMAADNLSDAASPSPAPDWGHVGGLSPADQWEYKGGVLGHDGNPDFSESKVWLYVESFKENMLNMHPVIQPRILEAWVRHFLESLPTVQPKTARPLATKSAFAIHPTVEATGAKRKRSPGPDSSDGQPAAAPVKSGKPVRSLVSAIVLMVLALGKICLHRDNIPDVVHPAEYLSRGNSHGRNGIPSSPDPHGSPPAHSLHSQSSGLPSPKEQERSLHSRRSSIQGAGAVRAGYSLKKNYEVIPGLEYFAYATDILGNNTGIYNNIKDVYASIFASLYQGQLGRPMESFAWIHRASHKLQVIMRPSLDRLRTLKMESAFPRDERSNQLVLAFWTCLQLESLIFSDLIAELYLPPSGLLQYEDDMPHPTMAMVEGFDQRVLDSYPGQLYLRRHLNSIHRMFYAPEGLSTVGKDKFQEVGIVADAVSGMLWVADSFAFGEDDPPARDILGARLRAKYWGAQVITYRPFIKQILHFSDQMKKNPSSPELPSRSEFRDDVIAPVIHPSTRHPNDIDPQVMEFARKGIKALVESTRAFHGLEEDKRPIITNVFGTAHAQWGNLLVLSAAWRDPILHQYIDESLLRVLFQKTIQFLRQSATATSSLRIDMNILIGLQKDLFGVQENRMNASFSGSHTSAQTPMNSYSMADPPGVSTRQHSPAIASPPPGGQQIDTHTSP
ncbi:hypothetical protein S40288_07421 [Stachybotrys chartarum IBT 40288]|nr:hypothetical protein S40288_07421 [Stachybotrys chartarum IBT 40288]